MPRKRTRDVPDMPKEIRANYDQLRAQATLLWSQGKEDEAKTLLAEAKKLETQHRVAIAWDTRNHFKDRHFSPILTDESNDIAISSMTVGSIELLKGKVTVEVIRAVRFGVQVLDKLDQRIPERNRNPEVVLKIATVGEGFDGPELDNRKRRSLDRRIDEFNEAIFTRDLINEDFKLPDLWTTFFEKASPDQYRAKGLMGKFRLMTPDGKSEGHCDIEDLLLAENPQKKDIDLAIRAARTLMARDRTARIVGTVRSGEKKRK